MKTLIFLFALVLGFALNAQDTEIVSKRNTSVVFTLDAGDTILNTATLDKVVDLRQKDVVQLYSFQLTLDSISGTPAHTTVLSGSMDNSTFYPVDTVAWAGSSADTTFYMTDISTGVAWKYLRFRVTGASTSKSQLTLLNGKVLDKVK